MTTERAEIKAPSAFAKFRLLMWKNFLQQWRHKGKTLAELLVPVATMSLILILRSQIEPETRDGISFPPLRADSLETSQALLLLMNQTHLSVAYSPESPVLEDVIQMSIARLFVDNYIRLLFPSSPSWIGSHIVPEAILRGLNIPVMVTAYASSADIQGIYTNQEVVHRVLLAVEFDDDLHGATELRDDLSFSLRFPETPRWNAFLSTGSRTWRTDSSFPMFELPGPRLSTLADGGFDPGYVGEAFIAFQQAISFELIRKLTGENLSWFTLNVQRFPHPKYLYDLAVDATAMLFPMFMMLSYVYSATNIIRAVTVEKEMQLKEMMKIMGLPTWLHWTAWFCKQFIYLLISAALIMLILKVEWFENEDGFGNYSVFTHTPATVLLFFIMLYLVCMIFFCFMISGFFSKGGTAALFGGIIWFLSYTPALLLSMDVQMSKAVQVITCFSINSAMSYGFQLLLARESTGGMQWSEFFFSPGVDSSRLVFGDVVLIILANCFLYMLVALYFEQVLPGPFGSPQPFYFFVLPRYWGCTKAKDTAQVEPIDDMNDIDFVMEKDPTDHSTGVVISNLTKEYGKMTAVNNLSLNIYDDQITVLLGHNGAGKSTTISMLTGNLEATRGGITVAGYDMVHDTSSARAHLGLCPQHNVLFSELTVREHLEFFARLKGFSGKQLDEEIDTLINKLELVEKRDYESHGLSGGQKRRLQMGIALSGAARVVLLDEPTSGMDPASRRALWELLQREKKGRSMILTTHFMDEADILGDRIAIMASGKLQCLGSPFFLKQHYGVGYTLVVVKNEGFQYELCTDLISKYIPGTNIKEDRGSEVTYSLPNDYSHVFEVMLKDLENNMETIRYKNYGLDATTLEDVFMTVGTDVTPVNSEAEDVETNADSAHTDDSLEQLTSGHSGPTGVRLIWQHMIAIWSKLLLVWFRSWQLVLLQILVPIVIVNANLGMLRFVLSFVEEVVQRELTLAHGYASTETLLGYAGSRNQSRGQRAMEAYRDIYAAADDPHMRLTLVEDSGLDDFYLKRTDAPTDMGVLRHQMLIGASFRENSATAWFSNFGYHDIANSVAAVQDALLRSIRPNASLTVYNYPLDVADRERTDIQFMVLFTGSQVANGIATIVGICSAVFIMFYIKERVSRAKLLQKASGIQPFTMWMSAAIFDWFWFLIICFLMMATFAIFQVPGIQTAAELGRIYILLMVYGAAMLPMMYIFSYLFDGPAVGLVVLFFVNMVFGLMGPQIVEALLLPELDTEDVGRILDIILQFFPMYSLIKSVWMLNQAGIQVWACYELCESVLPAIPNVTECSLEAMCTQFQDCCITPGQQWNWEEPGVLRYLVSMLGMSVVFWIILMIAEYRLVQKIFNRTRTPPPLNMTTLDPDVAAEAVHALRAPPSSPGLGLVATGLSKYYKNHLAVDQVSFTVADQECFGLLGVNGAGKTSTFKMLMGDETISSGDAFVSSHSVKKSITKVHESIGYCPQFDAVFPELTGRETLRLFSLLRGLPQDGAATARADLLARALGFHKHLDKRVSQYSGGNKRKLSTAVALLGRTRLVFVDEPTTGVDPAAKRQVWRVIRGAQRGGRGVVLTSHSMDECEALCTRLTIMVNGRFQCLGTPQHLKNKFSQGFTLKIKMKMEEDRAQNLETTNKVKDYVNSNFTNPVIMEEYQGLLTYYLPDRTMPWSRMFGILETAKQSLAIEDYRIAQTTLEQIFLQFTKYQR